MWSFCERQLNESLWCQSLRLSVTYYTDKTDQTDQTITEERILRSAQFFVPVRPADIKMMYRQNEINTTLELQTEKSGDAKNNRNKRVVLGRVLYSSECKTRPQRSIKSRRCSLSRSIAGYPIRTPGHQLD